MNPMKQNLVSWVAGLVLALAILGGLQYATRGNFADPDGFYHARSSQLLAAQEIGDQFPWLYYTTWNEGYANQHYIYHLLLRPFNTVEKLPISIVVFGLLFIGAFLATLNKYKISFKPFWVLLLLGSSVDFLFRISLVKANAISLALLCAIVFLIYIWHTQKNYYSLLGIGAVSALFVWTYGGFVCVPLLLGAYAVAEIISQRNLKLATLRKALLPIMISGLGIALGMVIHPQSHNLYSLLYDQLFNTGLGAGSVVPAGNEWLPFNLDWFIESNILILFAWVFSLVLFARALYKDRKNSAGYTLAMWLQVTTIGLMALTLWHRRFVEYWIPFAVFATAVTVQPYMQKLQWQEVKTGLRFWQVKVGVLMVGAFIIGISTYNIHRVNSSLRNGEANDAYKNAAQWVQENSEEGDIVLNTQWDQFPQLFYYNSKNYYIVGLDPTFMHIYDQEKYWQWRKIADDELESWESPEQVYGIVKKDLNSKFIFVDKTRNEDIYNYLSESNASEYFSLGFEDERFVVFEAR